MRCFACPTSSQLLMWHVPGQGLGNGAASLDDDEVLLALHCGEAQPKIELTRGQLRCMTLERMTEIWKVPPWLYWLNMLLDALSRKVQCELQGRTQ